jgi:hypothetical protein
MKKLLILSLILTTFVTSCKKDNEPDPVVIRAYVYLIHVVPGFASVNWVVDGVAVRDAMDYAKYLTGGVILESASDEIEFTVKNPGTGLVLATELLPLEMNKFYTVLFAGTAEEPVLILDEIDTTPPEFQNVKLEFFHAATLHDSIDVYIGDTLQDNKVITNLGFNALSDPFEVSQIDARTAIIVSGHSEEYSQDSVLLNSVNNELIEYGSSYLTVVAPFTYDPMDELTLWLYDLPVDN